VKNNKPVVTVTQSRTVSCSSYNPNIRLAATKVRAKPWLALCIAALVSWGCDSTESPDTIIGANVAGGSDLGLQPPSILLNSRMIDRDQLRVEATIGGESIPMQRNGDRWSGRFSLPGPGDHILEITWFERIDTVDLQLAQSEPLQLNESSSRNLSISSYNTNFDFDGDGMSNFDEREAGTNPIVASVGTQPDDDDPVPDPTPDTSPVPNTNQGDCRSLPTQQPLAPIINVSMSFEQLRTPTIIPGQLEYGESYWIQAPGVLRIEHVAGEPASSFSFIYDADLNGQLRLINTSELDLLGTGSRAVATPLQNLVLAVSFTAN